MRFNLPQMPWYGNTLMKLDLPDEWDEVMEIVGPVHGLGTKAVVLPNATMQYFSD
jgi:hypothetical protein